MHKKLCFIKTVCFKHIFLKGQQNNNKNPFSTSRWCTYLVVKTSDCQFLVGCRWLISPRCFFPTMLFPSSGFLSPSKDHLRSVNASRSSSSGPPVPFFVFGRKESRPRWPLTSRWLSSNIWAVSSWSTAETATSARRPSASLSSTGACASAPCRYNSKLIHSLIQIKEKILTDH